MTGNNSDEECMAAVQRTRVTRPRKMMRNDGPRSIIFAVSDPATVNINEEAFHMSSILN